MNFPSEQNLYQNEKIYPAYVSEHNSSCEK